MAAERWATRITPGGESEKTENPGNRLDQPRKKSGNGSLELIIGGVAECGKRGVGNGSKTR